LNRVAKAAWLAVVAGSTACAAVFGFERLEEGPGVAADASPPDGAIDGASDVTSEGTLDGAEPDGGPTSDATPVPVCPPPGDAATGCPADGGIVWNGRCYFVLRGQLDRETAATRCAAQQAELASFTCAEEWFSAGGLPPTNYWLGATFDGTQWSWDTGEPFAFVPPGGAFDASPPGDSRTCLWRDQRGSWIPTVCTATSAGAYCERP
jgi:Lectin C-type domain